MTSNHQDQPPTVGRLTRFRIVKGRPGFDIRRCNMEFSANRATELLLIDIEGISIKL